MEISSAHASPHTRNRLRMRQLDACLQQLEDLHERDLVNVPAAFAARLRPLVPGVRPDMRIADAIDCVFEQQEACLAPAGPGEVVTPAQRLEEGAARALTERIRSATRQVCILLLEAHEGQAWLALGYRTWELYVRREFGLSRSRSYELLDQARVIQAVSSAAGLSGIPDISAYAASQIKPTLDDVLKTIRQRTTGLAGRQAAAVVADVIRAARAPRAARPAAMQVLDRPAPSANGRGQSTEDSVISSLQLSAIIQYLASMPPAADVVSQLGDDVVANLTLVQIARRWLGELADACERQGARAAVRRVPDASEDPMSLAAG
jgi:hypothetical protein